MPERSGASAAQLPTNDSPHMRLVFLGSGAFGLPTFEALARMHDIALVVTQPDRPAQRGKKLTPTPIGEMAARIEMPVIKPQDINTLESIEQVRAVQPDAIVVIAYGQKIGVELRNIAPMINLHGSLLPKYRGAAPINWAVMNGETTAGVTIIDVADRMDAGAMYGSASTTIDPMETAGELHDRLAQLGPDLMLQVLDDIRRGAAESAQQNESQATKAPKLSKAIGTVSFDQPADRVRAMVHGLTPWPGCTVLHEKKRLKLLRVQDVESPDSATQPCAILDGGLVACATGAVQLLSVQPPGGKSMSFEAYCRGHEVTAGSMLMPIVEPSEQRA